MIYVFDSSPLINLFRHYYRNRFPTLWQQFDEMVKDGQITSTREVSKELDGQEDELSSWCKLNKHLFVMPSVAELAIVQDIFKVQHFQAIIRKNERLRGKPVADPFVIARAKCLGDACVVTDEKFSPNAAKLPNVCKHFQVDCTNLEGFMERENWRF
ncbi:MAG: DUF4411 family protein [Candidatus Competibacteraceae bacterium]|nr:DUF4411 family protein [Candidatus Competibacteraceae bacterium]